MASFIKTILSGRANKALLGVIVMLFGAYSFFIAHSIVAINQRKALGKTAQATQSQVSDLEIKYFNLASAIGTDTVASMGFVDSKTPDFAYTNPSDENAVAVR